ncbi:AAA family ATPase, partial [Aminiphilus sp.]|uniref:AAA family ATPase n=1 Tax=Aminiphilus sp. TaxID=1872488 RepID=UPI00261FF556
MPRSFCTEGPIDKERNYYVPRTELLAVGLKKVEEWRYFTLTAPRQSGKSTYFQFLADEIRKSRPDWLPLWISFEPLGNGTEVESLRFLKEQLHFRLNSSSLDPDVALGDFPDTFRELPLFLSRLGQQHDRDVVLIVDEMEGLQNIPLLNTFLHVLRSIYHDRRNYRLRSVILVGVSNITGILQSTASPFNIAEQITIPYFTREET